MKRNSKKQGTVEVEGKVWAYLRVSTDGQESGNGLDVQRQHIAAWAAANGVTVDRWIQDVESGAKSDRPGLVELRAGVGSGKVSQVLVYRLDRLARDVVLSESLYRELSATAKVVSVSESFGEGFTGNLMRQIIAAFAEYERAVIAGRLKGGRRESARSKGTFSGGQGVYGYRPVGTRKDRGYGALEVVNGEADGIRLAFELRGQGLTLKAIADRLNDGGFTTKNGAAFSPTQVMRILNREAFYRGAGVLATSYEATTGAHAPVLG
jgi:DNA invertase Pin-like site-specific DNA recombinase